MELYTQFNNTVYETFFTEEQKGALLILTIDEEFISATVKRFQLESSEFFDKIALYLSQDWTYIINRKSLSYPNYLGLIAIQIYAAHLMDEDTSGGAGYGENAYNPKLSGLLKVSLPILQALYSTSQEVLWNKFERWCNANGYEIVVPVVRTGARRYTQFPLSQAILNKKDLRQLDTLFRHVGLRPGENFHISDFTNLIRNADVYPYITKHYSKVKERLFAEGQCDVFYRQVFYHFNQWEETDSAVPLGDFSSSRFSQEKPVDFECKISHDLKSIDIVGPRNKPIRSYELCSSKALQSLYSDFRIGNNGCVVFVENTIYEEEWISQRYIDRNSPFLLIVERSNYSRRIRVAFGEYLKVIPNQNFDIFQGIIPEHAVLEDELCSILVKKVHVKLVGGLRLENKIWMEGAGPTLHLLQDGPIWINGDRISDQESISCTEFMPGRYAIKHRDYSPRVFYIQAPNDIDHQLTIDKGWRFSSWTYTQENNDLLGLYVKEKEDNFDFGSIRNWALAKAGMFKGFQSSINIKALNRAANGIDY
jgi:hypothetical protein